MIQLGGVYTAPNQEESIPLQNIVIEIGGVSQYFREPGFKGKQPLRLLLEAFCLALLLAVVLGGFVTYN